MEDVIVDSNPLRALTVYQNEMVQTSVDGNSSQGVKEHSSIR